MTTSPRSIIILPLLCLLGLLGSGCAQGQMIANIELRPPNGWKILDVPNKPFLTDTERQWRMVPESATAAPTNQENCQIGLLPTSQINDLSSWVLALPRYSGPADETGNAKIGTLISNGGISKIRVEENIEGGQSIVVVYAYKRSQVLRISYFSHAEGQENDPGIIAACEHLLNTLR